MSNHSSKFRLYTILLFVAFLLTSQLAAQEHHYCATQPKYHYQLNHSSASLEYDTVYRSFHNSVATLVFHNNTGESIIVNYPKVSDGSIYISNYPKNKTVAPKETFEVEIVLTNRIGPINRTIQVYYTLGEQKLASSVRIKGFQIDPNKKLQWQMDQNKMTALIHPKTSELAVAPPQTTTVQYSKETTVIECSMANAPPFLSLGQLKYGPLLTFKMINNYEESITIDSVVSSNRQMVFGVLHGCKWSPLYPQEREVISDSSFLIRGSFLYYPTANEINSDLLIYYRLKKGSKFLEDQKEYVLPIRGVINPQSSDIFSSSNSKPVTKNTSTKSTSPTPSSTTQQSYTYKTGVERFGKGTIVNLLPDQPTKIEVPLDEMKYYPSYPFKAPPRVPYIVSWDAISDENAKTPTLSVEMKNSTEKFIYLKDIEHKIKNVQINVLGPSIIPPDSLFRFTFSLSPSKPGNFYESVIFSFSNGTAETFKWTFYHWGYIKDAQNLSSASPNLSNKLPTDSIVFYVLDTNKMVTENYDLTFYNASKKITPKKTSILGKPCYVLPKTKDTLALLLENSAGKVILKEWMNLQQLASVIHLQVSPIHFQPHTYFRGFPIKYERTSSDYFLKWDQKNHAREEVSAYLEKFGLIAEGACSSSQWYVFVDKEEIKNIEQIQSQIRKSTYKIYLLPAIKVSFVNQHGWGGGCRWHDNVCFVGFLKGTNTNRVKEIFQKTGISSFQATPKFSDESKSFELFSFEFQDMTSLKFLQLMENLIQYDEVIYLHQNRGATVSLD